MKKRGGRGGRRERGVGALNRGGGRGVGEGAEGGGGGFGGEVALGFGEHFVTDHEIFDGGGAEERGIEVGVELPVVEMGWGEGGAVPAHGIRERDPEELIVAVEEFLKDLGKRLALRWIEVWEAGDGEFGEEKSFERPDGPVGDDD